MSSSWMPCFRALATITGSTTSTYLDGRRGATRALRTAARLDHRAMQNDSVTAPRFLRPLRRLQRTTTQGALLAVPVKLCLHRRGGRKRVRAALVGVLVAVAVGCGSTQDVLTSDRTGSPVTANSTVLSEGPETTDSPLGVSAPADAEVHLPFVLTVAPAIAHAGDAVHVSYKGDLSGDWMYGAGATLDVAVGDHWRTVWALINESFEAPASFDNGGQDGSYRASDRVRPFHHVHVRVARRTRASLVPSLPERCTLV